MSTLDAVEILIGASTRRSTERSLHRPRVGVIGVVVITTAPNGIETVVVVVVSSSSSSWSVGWAGLERRAVNVRCLVASSSSSVSSSSVASQCPKVLGKKTCSRSYLRRGVGFGSGHTIVSRSSSRRSVSLRRRRRQVVVVEGSRQCVVLEVQSAAAQVVTRLDHSQAKESERSLTGGRRRSEEEAPLISLRLYLTFLFSLSLPTTNERRLEDDSEGRGRGARRGRGQYKDEQSTTRLRSQGGPSTRDEVQG